MPTTQVEFDHGDESLNGVIDRGHGKERVGVGHKARLVSIPLPTSQRTRIGLGAGSTYLVMRSSMDLGSRMNVGSTTRLRSAPGRSCEMMCDRTGLVSLKPGEFGEGHYHFPDRLLPPLHPRSHGVHRWMIYLG